MLINLQSSHRSWQYAANVAESWQRTDLLHQESQPACNNDTTNDQSCFLMAFQNMNSRTVPWRFHIM